VCLRFGPTAIEPAFPIVCEAVLAFWGGTALCQQRGREGGEVDDEKADDANDEDNVLEAIADLVAAVNPFFSVPLFLLRGLLHWVSFFLLFFFFLVGEDDRGRV